MFKNSKVLITILAIFTSLSSVVAQNKVYVSSKDAVNSKIIIVPENVINKSYSMEQNGIAYYEQELLLKEKEEINFINAWDCQKQNIKTFLYFDKKQNKNIEKKLYTNMHRVYVVYISFFVLTFFYFFLICFYKSLNINFGLLMIIVAIATSFINLSIILSEDFQPSRLTIISALQIAIGLVMILISLLNLFIGERFYLVVIILSFIAQAFVCYYFYTPLPVISVTIGSSLALTFDYFYKKYKAKKELEKDKEEFIPTHI